MTNIGFIGLGLMGAPMAGHLLDAGFTLNVYNRTRAKAEELLGRNALTQFKRLRDEFAAGADGIQAIARLYA